MDKLKAIDILGREFQMKIEDGFTYKTKLGGILTIFVAIIPVISIYLFGRDIVEHENPSFIFRKNNLHSFPYVKMNSLDYFFGLRVADDLGGWIDDVRFFEVLFNYQYYVLNETTGLLDAVNNTMVPMTHCNTNHIDNETLYKEQLDTYYCADLNNLTFGGDWGQAEIGVITFVIKLCDQETEEKYNVTCYTQEDRVNKRGDTYFVETKYSNKVINPSNYLNPLISVIEYQLQMIDINLYKRSYFSYSQASLSTDEGAIQEFKVTRNFSIVEKTFLDIAGKKKDNKLFQLIVQLTNLKVEYERFYIKVQEIAAIVGGFFSITYNIIKAVFYFYVENHLQHYFYKKLLDLKIDNELFEPTPANTSLNVIPFNTSNLNFSIVDDEQTSKIRNELNESELVQVSKSKKKKKKEKDKKAKNESKRDKKEGNENNFHEVAESMLKQKFHLNLQTRFGDEVNKKQESNGKKHLSTKRLLSLLEYQKKERYVYQVNKHQLCKFRYCFCFTDKLDKTDGNMIKNQLLYVSEYTLNKKLDALNLLRILDQFKIFKQIFLNESQCYMLDNKKKKVICKTTIFNESDFELIIDEKRKIEEQNLAKYLKDKKDSNAVCELDSLLFQLMDDEAKNRIRNEVQGEIS